MRKCDEHQTLPAGAPRRTCMPSVCVCMCVWGGGGGGGGEGGGYSHLYINT